MNCLKNNYPIVQSKYKFTNIHPKSEDEYLIYIFKIFLVLFYPLCFGLGIMMYTYHSKFIHYAFYFLAFLALSLLIITPLHILIHVLAYPGSYNDENLYVGFNKKHLDFFAIYNLPLTRKRLLFSLLLPLLSLSFITLITLIFFYTNMFVYALFCVSVLLSVHDIYDAYVLIKYKDPKENVKYTKIENSIYKTN